MIPFNQYRWVPNGNNIHVGVGYLLYIPRPYYRPTGDEFDTNGYEDIVFCHRDRTLTHRMGGVVECMCERYCGVCSCEETHEMVEVTIPHEGFETWKQVLDFLKNTPELPSFEVQMEIADLVGFAENYKREMKTAFDLLPPLETYYST
jgi:hypothetical protein